MSHTFDWLSGPVNLVDIQEASLANNSTNDLQPPATDANATFYPPWPAEEGDYFHAQLMVNMDDGFFANIIGYPVSPALRKVGDCATFRFNGVDWRSLSISLIP